MFDFKNAEERTLGSYLNPGIHKVKVTEVKFNENEQGGNIDITLTDSKGAAHNWRKFPFKFNPEFKSTEAEQFNDYLANLKHVFKRAIGEDLLNKVASVSKDYATLAAGLNKAVKSNASKEFYIMLIHKKNYTRVPEWAGGFAQDQAEFDTLPLQFDEVKYGKPAKPAGAFESASPTNGVFDPISEKSNNSPTGGVFDFLN